MPTQVVSLFTDPGRLSLLRVAEKDYLNALEQSLLTEGVKTPLEMYMDKNGKARLQEGYHRMCVVLEHLEKFPKVPILFTETSGSIKSYGRPVVEEFPSILQIIGTK